MKNNKKGMFLIYVLFTAVLITIFLLTAVGNLQNTYFQTKKFLGENKAYWVAEAGIQYCEYKLKTDLGWPFVNTRTTDNNQTGTETFGKFTVTSSLINGNKGYLIHGTCEEDSEEFCIYFSKRKSKTDTNLVPMSFPSTPSNISYCSYNSVAEGNLDNIMQNNNIEYSDIQFTVSKSPEYKTVIITPSIYITSDGRCRGHRAVIEKMFVPDYGNTNYGGGIYAGGDIDISLVNQNNSIKVNQISNAHPKVYCKKNVKIARNSEWINAPMSYTTNNTSNYSFPFSISDGTIYMNNLPYIFEIKQQAHNGKNHGIDTITNNGNLNNGNADLKQQYGINIEKYTESDEDLFPQVTWKDIEVIKQKEEGSKDKDGNNILENINGGSYISIFNEDEGNYDLIWLPDNFLRENGEPDEEVIEKCKRRITEEEEKEISNILSDRNNYNRDGKFIAKDKLAAANQKLNDLVQSSSKIIKNFAERGGGKIICTSDADNKDKKSELINKIINKNTEFQVLSSDIFSIKTVEVTTIKKFEKKDNDENKYDIEYESKKTPIITVKKSIALNGNSNLNLLTFYLDTQVHTSNNSDGSGSSSTSYSFNFSIADDISTDLILDKKVTGFNESYELAKGTKDNNLIIGDGVNIYSNGSVIINGKLSGKGQIFSKKNMFFKAGTQLNTSDYEDITKEFDPMTHTYKITDIKEKENIGEISKLALYSKGTMMMNSPSGESEENLKELHNKIKNLLAGKDSTGEKKLNKIEASTTKEIVNNLLYTEVKVNAGDLSRIASSIIQDKTTPNSSKNQTTITSAIIVNDMDEPISLLKLMRKYYGFEEREAKNYIEEIVKRNCIYNEGTDTFKMPEEYDQIKIISTRGSSSYSGLIYACGGFICNAENNNIVINGTIVSYGADPASSAVPGSKGGLDDDLLTIKNKDNKTVVDFTSKPGTIKITDCKDFSVVYDSTDLASFVHKYSSNKPINLSTIYCNKL